MIREETVPIGDVRVIDGDTLAVTIRWGFHGITAAVRLRLAGVDTQRGNTPAGKTATAYVQEWLREAEAIRFRSDLAMTHGRYLAVVFRPLDGLSLNDALLADGHAVPYL